MLVCYVRLIRRHMGCCAQPERAGLGAEPTYLGGVEQPGCGFTAFSTCIKAASYGHFHDYPRVGEADHAKHRVTAQFARCRRFDMVAAHCGRGRPGRTKSLEPKVARQSGGSVLRTTASDQC